MTEDPRRVPVLTADEAVGRIPPGAVLTISGVVGSLVPDATLEALRRRFDHSEQPSGLTVVFPVAVGDVAGCPGVDRLAHPHLISTVIGGSFVYGVDPVTKESPELPRLLRDGAIEGFNLPIGVMLAALREVAAGRPGLFTKVGLGTFQDPRNGGGRLHESTPTRFVTVREIDGEEYLHVRLPKPDVAIIRGSIADEFGNVSMRHESLIGGVLVQAMAAHRGGGLVIAEVEQVVAAESLPAREVTVPGVLVDAVVQAPGQQATGVKRDPFLSGELRAPAMIADEPLAGAGRIVLDRVRRLLRPGELVILGFGIPSHLPMAPRLPAGVRFTIEHGAIGGAPAGGPRFGGAVNAEALLDGTSMFDLIDGGGCDTACLGFAEIGPDGAVNVSKLPTHLPGSGGFTNITASTRRLIFCGTFTAGGLKVRETTDGVRIVDEGRFRKLVLEPRQRTFDATRATDRHVVYVTERCTLELRDGGLVVTDLYPGIDLQRDVLDQAEFEIGVAPGVSA
jgi:propionate CoA-transferase